MKKQKPVRKNQSREELREYFSDCKYDSDRQFINRIMDEHPEAADAFVIESAAAEMHESAYSGVLLSTDDALRLVEYKEPVSIETLVKTLTDAGINDSNIFDLIFNTPLYEEDYTGCSRSRHALHTTQLLQKYADMLTRNRDVILLSLPEYDFHDDSVCVTLAFLGEELTRSEQGILEQMKDVADHVRIKTEYEVTRVIFYIDNVWEKNN